MAATLCSSCHAPLNSSITDLTADELTFLQRTKSKSIHIVCKNCETNFSQLKELKEDLCRMQALFEKRLEAIEAAINSPRLDITIKEEIIQESVERTLRSSNIILANVPEDPNIDDITVANDILELIDPEAVVSPGYAVRVGKSSGVSRPRLLKLKFKSPEIARMVLRKKSALAKTKFNKIVIRDDKTPMQLKHLNDLRAELARRNSNGVRFTIKYIHGVPQIVEIHGNPQPSSSSTSPNLN